jgi:glutathione S-transferase
MLRLLGRNTSGNVQKVIFLLEELGAPYTREDYGRQFNNTQDAAYLKLNPNGKVPTLVDGDTKDSKKAANERAATFEADAKELAAQLSILDGAMAGKAWVAGKDFTIADVALGPVMHRGTHAAPPRR